MVELAGDPGVCECVGGPVPRRLLFLAQVADQVLGLGRHRLWILETFEILHHLLHLQLVDTFMPNRMLAGEQVKQNDATGPHICLLRVGKNIRYLLRRLKQESATFGEISDCIEGVLDSEAEIDQFDLGQVLVAPQNNVVRLYVSVNNVLLIVHVR